MPGIATGRPPKARAETVFGYGSAEFHSDPPPFAPLVQLPREGGFALRGLGILAARDNPVYHVLGRRTRLCYDPDMTDPAPTLAAHQIAMVQSELRAALGLSPEQFPLPTVISMMSDEIEQLRERGFADADIAKIIQGSRNITVSAEDIGLHYAPPEARGRPED